MDGPLFKADVENTTVGLNDVKAATTNETTIYNQTIILGLTLGLLGPWPHHR